MKSTPLCQALAVTALCTSSWTSAVTTMADLHLADVSHGWGGELDLSLSGSGGNTVERSVEAGARLSHGGEAATYHLLGSYAYGSGDGVADTDKAFVHLRALKPWQSAPEWQWDTYGQWQQNRFTRLGSRELLGLGVRHRDPSSPAETPSTAGGLGAFYEREQLDATGTEPEQKTHTWRGNLYAVVRHRFGQGLSLSSGSYLQPALDDLEDVRLLQHLSVSVPMTQALELVMDLVVSHDSAPPAKVDHTDWEYLTRLRYRF